MYIFIYIYIYIIDEGSSNKISQYRRHRKSTQKQSTLNSQPNITNMEYLSEQLEYSEAKIQNIQMEKHLLQKRVKQLEDHIHNLRNTGTIYIYIYIYI